MRIIDDEHGGVWEDNEGDGSNYNQWCLLCDGWQLSDDELGGEGFDAHLWEKHRIYYNYEMGERGYIVRVRAIPNTKA